jgi:hypothetical protein
MFDAIKAANFSPIEQLLAAAIIVLVLLFPWWVSVAAAVGLAGRAAWRIRVARSAKAG